MGSQKTALITGVSGQDGSYLVELLDGLGYCVHGTSHRAEGTNLPGRLSVQMHQLDLADAAAIEDLVARVQPHEIYNLAARASSAQLFEDPILTAEINGLATVRFLEAIRRYAPATRFCQAASSEIFAGARVSPQNEYTEVAPINSYGAAKAYGLHMLRMYRSRYGLHAGVAILFNHESPRRSEHFVTRKISRAVAMIEAGLAGELVLGSLDSVRDWGFAGDYANAMYLMLQHERADDYVIATGKTHSVGDFCRIAFEYAGLNYQDYVKVDSSFVGRTELVELRGDPSRAEAQLGWRRQVDFVNLVKSMVDADRALVSNTR